MFSKRILFLLAPLFCAVQCLAIFGGGRVIFRYPFFVVITIQKQHQTVTCGGTIIAADVILTATHCLFDFETKEWVDETEITIIKNEFTEKYWNDDPEKFSRLKYVAHQAYNPFSHFDPFDIAVIQTRECIDQSKPENGVLKPCRSAEEYRKGLAIGIDAIKKDLDLYPNRLMGTTLRKIYHCAWIWIFRDKGVEIDEGRQVCYGSCEGNFRSPCVSWSLPLGY